MTSIQIDRTDGLSSSVAVKGPCRVATTANITLSGTQTIDGVAVVTDDRVLVKDQTTASENGIYVADTGPWRRAKDFSRTSDVITGTHVYVTSGSVAGGGSFIVATTGAITIGTTSISFSTLFSLSSLGGSAAGIDGFKYDFDTVTLLIADTVRTYSNTTAGDYIRTRAEGFSYLVAASGASDHNVTTGGGLKLYVVPGAGGFVALEMWGATGGDAAVDTPAIVGAAASRLPVRLGPYSYRTTTGFSIYNLWEGTAGTEGGGNAVSRILCVADIPAIVTVAGNRAAFRNVTLHGSFIGHPTSAMDGVVIANGNSSSVENVTVEFCRRHGFALSDGGGENNNAVNLKGCTARWNGRIDTFNVTRSYPASGLYRPANVGTFNVSGTSGTNTLTLNTPWDPTDYEIDPKHSLIWVSGGAAYMITAVTTTTITVYPALKATHAAVAFSIHTGSGVHVPHHTDNNVLGVFGGFFYGNAGVNIWDQAALPGHYYNVVSEWGGLGNFAFGHASNAYGRSFAPLLSGCYTEQGSASLREVWGAYVTDMVIQACPMAESTAGRTDTYGDYSQRDWRQLVLLESGSTIKDFGAGALLDFRAVTNAASYNLDARITSWRQSGASVDFDVLLPTAPVCGTDTPETYILALTEIGGKICTVKTASAGTLINNVAGTTGVAFRGNHRELSCVWNTSVGGWTVSATTSTLYGSATYNPASLADGVGATTTVTVTGAALGDIATASFSLDLQGITLTAWVSAADTVSVRFQNESGGVLDLASGTLTAMVMDIT